MQPCPFCCLPWLQIRPAPTHSGGSILVDSAVVGTVTSAGYGHRVKQNIAFAFIDPEFAKQPELTVQTARGLMGATIGPFCRYDAENELVKQ